MATAMTFKRVAGFAKESGWPPSSGTDPTVWAPSYEECDFFQEPAVLTPPQTRGDRGFYNHFKGAWTTTGSISGLMLTPDLLALLLEGILSKTGGVGYYYRGDAIPPSFCVTWQKGGIWWQALGMYMKTFNITFAPELATVAIDFAGYAVIQSAAKTPSFPAVKAYPFWNLTVEVEGAAVEAKEISLNIESGIPDANIVSGSRYTSTLVPGELNATVDFSVEKTQQRILDLIEPQRKEIKLVAKTQDDAKVFTVHLPQCYPVERPDLSDSENIIWRRVSFRAEVDTVEGYEIRAHLS